jgi:hypothetical protein
VARRWRQPNSGLLPVPASAERVGWDGPTAWGLVPELEAAGLNVVAGISRDRYDRLVPESWRSTALLPSAESALILGSGGSDFFRHAMAEYPESPHPLDEFCERHVHAAADALEAAGWKTARCFYWERRGGEHDKGGVFADFVKLAEACGLGSQSRLGLLLHREFGPWFAIRGLLLSERPLASGGSERRRDVPSFDPCTGCDAPCREACPGRAVGPERFSGEECSLARRELETCRKRCAARIACPVGAAHRYPADAVAHHMQAAFRGSLPACHETALPAGRAAGSVGVKDGKSVEKPLTPR